MPMNKLAFELCSSCGLVKQQEPFPSGNYAEVNRAPKRRLPPYVSSILDAIRSEPVQLNDLVLEIGCNDGALLMALRRAGFSNLLGVEPSRSLCDLARLTAATVINDYFTSESAEQILNSHGAPKAVICRHTLEHVPDVTDFLSGMRKVAAANSAITIIEVPDSSIITDRGYFFELWDEHLYYFHADNLGRLAVQHGFHVTATEAAEHQETRNLLITLSPTRAAVPIPASVSRHSSSEAWCTFGSRWAVFREGFLGDIIKARKPVYLIGAGHLQTNLVNFLGPGAEVDYLIDDDPGKRGRVAPIASGSAQIISTEEFMATATAGTVIASGFGYPAWSEKIIRRAHTLGIVILDPRKVFSELIEREPR